MFVDQIERREFLATRVLTFVRTEFGRETLRQRGAIWLWIIFAVSAGAQEAVRMSLAGAAAAEARRRAALSLEDCSLRLGPTAWALSAGLALEASDNIQFDSAGQKSDLIARPQIDSRMVWRVSENNSVNLALGGGYSAYVAHPGYNRLFVTPGSELTLDTFAGDFWINAHERLSVTENAYQDPTVIGTGDFSQLQNVAGLNGTWDLNKMVLRLGYDHANYKVVSGGAGVPDGDSEVFALSAGYRFAAALVAGLESGGGMLHYSGENAGVTRAVDWNVGAFFDAQVTEKVKVRANAGYTAYVPQAGSAQLAATEFTGVYARLGVNHTLNRYVDYGLDGGRSISFAFFGGTVDLYTAMFEARWHVFRKLSLGTRFEFEHGSQVFFGQQTFDRFGPGLNLDRQITKQVSADLRYQYYQRQSDVSGGDYAVNIVTLSLVFRL